MSVQAVDHAVPPDPAPRSRRIWWRRWALAGLALLALAGTVLAVQQVGTGRDAADAARAARGFGIGEDVTTSFGAVAVEIVSKVGGPTDGQLTGASHGINGNVAPTQELIEVTAVMTNQTRTTLAYSPDQWRLRAGDAAAAVAEHANVGPGVLQPAASIELRLRFVAPRAGERLSAEFTDPRTGAVQVIDLGRTSSTPYGTDDTHQH